MSAFLRASALVSLGWAVLVLGFKDRFIGADQLSPAARSVANAFGIAHVVLAYVFWYAAGAPAANRGAVYAAIMLAALKTANDLYDLLVLVPADRALVSLGDLVLSVALLVGLLEALPRTLGAPPRV